VGLNDVLAAGVGKGEENQLACPVGTYAEEGRGAYTCSSTLDTEERQSLKLQVLGSNAASAGEEGVLAESKLFVASELGVLAGEREGEKEGVGVTEGFL
jgi:hypothetical protein